MIKPLVGADGSGETSVQVDSASKVSVEDCHKIREKLAVGVYESAPAIKAKSLTLGGMMVPSRAAPTEAPTLT